MRITGGQVFDLEQGFVSRDVCFDGEKLELSSADGKTYDASGCYVIPGLTDLHFHGCVGEDFSDATPDGLQKMADYELSRGVTQICPAGMTLGEDQLTRICQNAAAHRAKNPGGAELVGLHLEGPFLCKAKKGAQNEAFLHDPDPAMLHRLQQAAQGMVKLVTLAAEQPGALEFIRSAQEDGITVSLGHTTADYDTACAAYEAGARQATHLFNAMPPFTHRAPGVVGAAFDHPQVKVELISDGPTACTSTPRWSARCSSCLEPAGSSSSPTPCGPRVCPTAATPSGARRSRSTAIAPPWRTIPTPWPARCPT